MPSTTTAPVRITGRNCLWQTSSVMAVPEFPTHQEISSSGTPLSDSGETAPPQRKPPLSTIGGNVIGALAAVERWALAPEQPQAEEDGQRGKDVGVTEEHLDDVPVDLAVVARRHRCQRPAGEHGGQPGEHRDGAG